MLSQDSTDILKQGYLTQKTERSKRWKTRRVILREDCLEYYYRAREKICARILLNYCIVSIADGHDTKRKNVFRLIYRNPKRVLLFQAASESEMNNWVLMVGAAIREIRSKIIPLSENETKGISSDVDDEETNLSDVLIMMENKDGTGLPRNESNNTFSGYDAVEWLLNWKFAKSRTEALDICQQLACKGFFEQTEPAHSTAFLFQDLDFVRYAFTTVSLFRRQTSVTIWPNSSSDETSCGDSGDDSGIEQQQQLQSTTKRSTTTSSSLKRLPIFTDILRVKSTRRKWRVRKAIVYENPFELRLFTAESDNEKCTNSLKIIDLGRGVSAVKLEDVVHLNLEGVSSSQKNVFVIRRLTAKPLLFDCSDKHKRDDWIKLINSFS